MLFRLSDNTPIFQVFTELNDELKHFIEQSIARGEFRRDLFTTGDVGQACWDNAKVNSTRASSDLTRDKFEKLFDALQMEGESLRRQLYEVFCNNQDLKAFFASPDRDLLAFLPNPCFEALKNIATHLYSATKDLSSVISGSGGVDISMHFALFRDEEINGNVCKACGMEKLSALRAHVSDDAQWRADYDHQLCKSKYPIFAVHPKNLIPLCNVCNQDAKKVQNLFRSEEGRDRLAFYPYTEEANRLVEIVIENDRDPEPIIKVIWSTEDEVLINKLDTWDQVYVIRNRVEGSFRSLEKLILCEIQPSDFNDLEAQIQRRSREVQELTLKLKEWAFWHQKLFQQLSSVDLAPFWEKSRFAHQHGEDGGEFILNEV